MGNRGGREDGRGPAGIASIFRGLVEALDRVPPEARARFSDENLCRRCGKCCFCGTRVKDSMVGFRELPCKYLEFGEDGLASCSIYEWKDQTDFCQSVGIESIRSELFPPDCPYVEGIKDYQGKIFLAEDQLDEVLPILGNVFKLFECPAYIRQEDWNRFLKTRLGLAPKS